MPRFSEKDIEKEKCRENRLPRCSKYHLERAIGETGAKRAMKRMNGIVKVMEARLLYETRRAGNMAEME